MSNSVTSQFPGKYRRIIGCSHKLNVYKPNLNGQWPLKARNITFTVSTPDEKLLLTVKWIANTANMNGFKIILKSTNRSDICIIYDYTDSVKNYPPDLYSFSVALKMLELHRHRNFTGLLFPLPSPDTASQAVTFNTSIPIDCSQYTPYFTEEYDEKYLHVTVYKPPAECNYKEYQITLFQNKNRITKKIIPIQPNVDKLETTMELNLCNGKYQVWVTAYYRHIFNQSRCVCKDLMNRCRSCTNGVKEKIYSNPAKKCIPKTSNKFVLYLCQFFLGLSLLCLLTITTLYLKSNFLARKRGIAFFQDDHEPHTNAITKLLNYMNKCNLRVSPASAFLKNPDIPNQLDVMTEALKSDFILLVLSNALQKRMEAWDKQQDYVEFFKEVNSNILTKQFLEILMASNKLHVCKFDHVDGFGHWPKPYYSLPTDLTKMTTDLMGRSCCQNLCKFWKSRTLFVELYKAIQEAFLYEQSHKNWLEEKYRDRKTL